MSMFSAAGVSLSCFCACPGVTSAGGDARHMWKFSRTNGTFAALETGSGKDGLAAAVV